MNILANKFDLLKKNIQNSDKMLFFLNYLIDNESSFKVAIRLCEHSIRLSQYSRKNIIVNTIFKIKVGQHFNSNRYNHFKIKSL